MVEPLTAKQTALLDFIRAHDAQHHYAPTFEEIRSGLNWSSKSLVDYQLTQLEAAGYITRTHHTPRAILLIAR